MRKLMSVRPESGSRGMALPGRDLPWKDFFARIKNAWLDHDLSNVAGTLTFFSVLALFPFLLFLVALAGLLMDPHQVASLLEPLTKVAPAAVVQVVGGRLRSLAASRSVGILTGSIVVTLYSASGAMKSLIDALDRAWGVKDSRSYLRRSALALGMTLFTTVFVLAAGVGAVALLPIGNAVGGTPGALLGWLRLPAAAVLMMLLWAVLYWALPDVEQRFRLITPGSVVGVLLWVLASWGFSQYVAHFGSYEVVYGALGGVVILLVWMWISAQVLLLGAEINAILERASRTRQQTESLASAGAVQVKRSALDEQHRFRRTGGPPRPSWTRRMLEVALAALVFRLLERR